MQVYDTVKYDYKFFKIIDEDSTGLKSQTFARSGKLKVAQYTLLKDDQGSDKSELSLIFYDSGKLKRNGKKNFVTSEELIKTYYENGQVKSEVTCVADSVKTEVYYSELGDVISKPIISEGIPKDGLSGWNNYLAKTLRYPIDARMANQEGKVIISFQLTEEGKIIDPEIANPEEIHPSLGAEALRAVKKYPYTWTPYTVNGVPEKCITRLPVNFELTD